MFFMTKMKYKYNTESTFAIERFRFTLMYILSFFLTLYIDLDIKILAYSKSEKVRYIFIQFQWHYLSK